MKKIQSFLIVFLVGFINVVSFAGTFSTSIYGNIEGAVGGTRSTNTQMNAAWESLYSKAYFEIKLSGRDLLGFDYWSKIGGTAEFSKTTLTNNGGFVTPLFNGQGTVNTNLKGNDNNNYLLQQWEAHVQKNFTFKKGNGFVALYRGENRSDVGQPYLSFFGNIGDAATKTGLQWYATGLLGLTTKGFVLDYRSDMKDLTAPDINAYLIGGRISRVILKKSVLNLSLGFTGGISQYYKSYTFSDVPNSSLAGITNKYFYNIAGFDLSMNGTVPVVGNYYFFLGAGRSYAPEQYPYEQHPLIAITGNSNAMMLVSEFKWSRGLQFAKIDFGKIYVGVYLSMRQPDYQLYLGGNADPLYQELFTMTYNFPAKAISINSRFLYKHKYDFNLQQYHLWDVGDVRDSSVLFARHLDLNIIFKKGFSFVLAYDNEIGTTYTGKYDTNGINYLTINLAGESKLGKISPQLKIVALGNQEKQLISSGIEILLNMSKVLKLYSRFAYVSSAGFWKSGDSDTWWNAFMQLQIYAGNNSKLFLEYGDGDATSHGFVSDKSLINGAAFRNYFHVKFEYWL